MIARESCAPRQARGEAPGSSLDQLRALGCARRRSWATSYGCSGSSSSRLATISVGTATLLERHRRRRTRVERGTTRSASATASGCRWRSIRWRIASTINPRNARLDRRVAVGAHETLDAVALEPVGQRVPARQLVAGRVCGSPRWAGVTCTSAATRSGCASASASVVAAPIEAPDQHRALEPALVEHAPRGRATRSAYSYAPRIGRGVESPCPRAS